MKIFIPILCSFILFFVSCKSSTEDKASDEKGVETIKVGSEAEARKMLDSILKASGSDVQITMQGGDSVKISASVVKEINGSDLKVINAKKLDSLIRNSSKKYTVVHFWATWCKPCRKEFPDLIKAFSKIENASIILVSCDYNSDEQKKKVLSVYNELSTSFPCFINETMDKSDAMGTESQRNLIKHYGMVSDGGLPYNLIIENKAIKGINGYSSYEKVVSALK